MTRTRATILIIAIFLLVFGVIFGSYIYFSKDKGEGTVEEIQNTFRSFFPFGDSGKTSGDEKRNPTEDVFPEDSEAPVLRKISNEPVSGFYAFSWKVEGKDVPFVRYVQRATGHVYETKNNSLDVVRISNTTLPKITESFWLSTTSVVYRYLDEDNENIKTFKARLLKKESDDTGSEPYRIEGTYLEDGIKEITVSKEGNIFYLTMDESNSYGTKIDFGSSKNVSLFKSALREWLINWSSGKTIWLSTKPSYKTPGYVYSLSAQSGALGKIFGGQSGLTARANTDNTKLLYSHIESGRPVLKIFDVKESGSNDIFVSTLSDKCVWGNLQKEIAYCAVPKDIPNVSLPDDWYQGAVTFSDSIWKIDTENVSTEFISSISEDSGEDIDAINLSLTPDDNYLVFQNKKDLTLWSLKLIDDR